MTKTFIIEKGQTPAQEQLQEVQDAQKHPIEFDEDCPELSPAMYKAFKSAVIQRNRKKNAWYIYQKPVIGLSKILTAITGFYFF